MNGLFDETMGEEVYCQVNLAFLYFSFLLIYSLSLSLSLCVGSSLHCDYAGKTAILMFGWHALDSHTSQDTR